MDVELWPRLEYQSRTIGSLGLLTLAIRLHIYDLQVFGDSRIIIDWLNQKCDLQVMDLMFWKERLKALTREFSALEFTHTYRDFNQEADELSKQALEQSEGKIKYTQMEDGHVGSVMELKLF
jgi:hypothetical protein